MTLWILFCRMTNEVDTLFTFYAKDRHHAELKAEEILDWYCQMLSQLLKCA